ncbi:MAG: hypothetical protein IIV45_13655, partial [Lachnospiraceae bacterium]|nr:hypothetical protein [Lachnospiraceae bacterium]
MEKFINPYNFIPFGDDKAVPKNEKANFYSDKKNLRTGWLEVSMYTRTPLIVPNGAYPKYIDTKTGTEVEKPSEQQKKACHKKYAFMRDPNGVPFVPGSEIRGMVRSAYEAVTNSCVPVLLNDKPISHRVPTFSAIKKRGLLQHKDDHWILYNTDASKVEVTVDEKNVIRTTDGETVEEKPGSSPDNENSFLQYNIPVVKKNYHIAYLKPKDVVYEWEKKDNYAYDKLRSVLNIDGVVGSENPNKEPQSALLEVLKEAVKNENQMVPVYYFSVNRRINGQDTKLVYLSGSSIGRIAQYREWEDI